VSKGSKRAAAEQQQSSSCQPTPNTYLTTPPHNVTPAGENNVNGFGLEFFIETPAAEIGTSLTDIKKSWQFQLLYTVSQLAAGHGGISSIIDDMQLLSTEAEGVNEAIPEERRKALVNRAGRVGALLGLTDTRAGAADCECQRRTCSSFNAAVLNLAWCMLRCRPAPCVMACQQMTPGIHHPQLALCPVYPSLCPCLPHPQTCQSE
jgi:hypothetical protein